MNPQAASQVDLARAFSKVTTALKENQQSLNAADDYNHNHGDNMVNNFQVITRAVRAKKDSPPSEQLEYASQALARRSQSGSAQLYSQGLAQAAARYKDQPGITPENAMQLVQALMGSQSAAQTSPQSQGAGMEDLLGSLLGSGSSSQNSTPQGQSAGGDLLGGLLGAFMGGGSNAPQSAQPGSSSQAGAGIDLNTLLTAGMAFFQARQQGAAPVQAMVQAVMAGSQMQSSAAHSQSGELVAGTLINTIGSMLSGKK